jgi:hypothetical protein
MRADNGLVLQNAAQGINRPDVTAIPSAFIMEDA